MPSNKKQRVLTYVMLHGILALYSVAGVCSKTAASHEFLTFWFIFFYGMVLIILFAYALLWQQVLKRLPLTTAFANKGITVVWGMLWGALIFSEAIDIKMLIGAAVVITGVVLVVLGERKPQAVLQPPQQTGSLQGGEQND